MVYTHTWWPAPEIWLRTHSSCVTSRTFPPRVLTLSDRSGVGRGMMACTFSHIAVSYCWNQQSSKPLFLFTQWIWLTVTALQTDSLILGGLTHHYNATDESKSHHPQWVQVHRFDKKGELVLGKIVWLYSKSELWRENWDKDKEAWRWAQLANTCLRNCAYHVSLYFLTLTQDDWARGSL